MTRLATYFNVVWVNPPRGWREALFDAHPPSRSADYGCVSIPGFSVYQHGKLLPKFYRPELLASYTSRQRLVNAHQILRKNGSSKTILYLWRPEFEPALESLKYDLSCYHIDDEYSFSDVDMPLDNGEVRLIKRVDQVFIHSPGLFEKKGHLNPNTLIVPNGTNYHAFAKTSPEPDDLAGIPHPRIGYTGVIKRTLDWPLLIQLAKRHPEWSYIFIGPKAPHQEIQEPLEELSHYPNVYFLEAKPAAEISGYPQHFDVCIMPYRSDCHMTKYGLPLKLHEYLASGRPTVASKMYSLEEFSDVITIANSYDEWNDVITASLAPSASTFQSIEARRQVARKYDWDTLVRNIAGTLCMRLGHPYQEQFDMFFKTSE